MFPIFIEVYFMSKITKEKLLAGIIFGDNENKEYIYLPGGEVGSENPLCVLERGDFREDLPLEQAAQMVHRLALRPCTHPIWGKRSY